MVDIMWRYRGTSHLWWRTAQAMACNSQLGTRWKITWKLKGLPKTPPEPQKLHQSHSGRALVSHYFCDPSTLQQLSVHQSQHAGPPVLCHPRAMVELQGDNGTGWDLLGATEICFPSSCDKSDWQYSDCCGKLCKCMSGLLLHWGESPISDLLEWQL